MKALRLLLPFSLLLGFMCGCQKKEITSDERADAERIIKGQQALFSQAIADKDADALVSLYANNGALYYDDDPIIRGKTAIRERWKSDFARPGLTMKVLPGLIEISNAGDMAWTHSTFRLNANLPVGSGQWRSALIFKRLPEGWKLWADSANSDLHHQLSKAPAKGRSPWAPLAFLIGLGCFLSTLWFLTGMPIVAILYGWKALRSRTWSTGLIVSICMLLAFFLVALLFWLQLSGHYWNLSIQHAFIAATDTERYGNPVEDTAESVLISLMVISALSGLCAGIFARTACWLSRRRQA
jgi:ketosteroid isomerase-like protein